MENIQLKCCDAFILFQMRAGDDGQKITGGLSLPGLQVVWCLLEPSKNRFSERNNITSFTSFFEKKPKRNPSVSLIYM